MTNRIFFLSAWRLHPWVVAISLVAILVYYSKSRFRLTVGLAWLIGAVVVLLLALGSPIAVLAEGYLFSAHMLQHLLLILLVPALLCLSLTARAKTESLRPQSPRWADWMVRYPLIPWLFGVGGMWLWHAPLLCNAAVSNVWVQRGQTFSLLLMGLVFWWPIVGPYEKQRLSPPVGIIYLFSACLGCSILGIIITFAPVEICAVYLQPVDRLGILSLIRDQWGLTSSIDQQVGGLLMWVPACLIYISAIILLFARWHSNPQNPASVELSRPKTISREQPHEP